MLKNNEGEIITDQTINKEVITSQKARAYTSESIPLQPTQCALIMLHTDSKVPRKIINSRCIDLGYEPIFFPIPDYEDDENSTQSLKKLEIFLSKLRNKKIIFVLADANYNNCDPVNKKNPNSAVLLYILKTVKPKFFFVTSETEGCLDKVMEDKNLAGILITTRTYSTISETVPPTEKALLLRKNSLPHDTSNSSDELNDKVKQKTTLLTENHSIDHEMLEISSDELPSQNNVPYL